jgi:hypothetical protein
MSTNYEQFIAANHTLMNCYAEVPADSFSAMSKSEQEGVCRNEANAVRGFIAQEQVNFRSILNERISAFDAKQE